MTSTSYHSSQILFNLTDQVITMSGHNNFGEWLKAARRGKFTQEGLAEAAHNVCTGAYISALETSSKRKKGRPIRPDESIVEALAKALDRDVNEARLAAGYAPREAQEMKSKSDYAQVLETVLIAVNGLSSADRRRLLATLYSTYSAPEAPEPPVTPAHLRPPGNAEFVVDENDVEPVSFRRR